jgi:hypothetical protein
MITNLNLADKFRSNRIQGDKPKQPAAEKKTESKDVKEEKK